MKIETASSYVLVAPLARASTTPPRPTGLGDSASAEQAGGIKRADFSSMSRQDMRNWLNEQIRSGQMSLDDSSPFMAMTMKMPVEGQVAGPGGAELAAAADTEQIDFVARVRDGMLGAQSRGDRATWTMLESALQTMMRWQGQAVGVDVRA